MIVGFTGSSRHSLTDTQIMEVRSIIESDEVTEVHHGDCVGADASFHNIAKESRKRIVIHPPENDKHRAYKHGDRMYPLKPYLQRNHDIVESSDMMIACPDSSKEKLRSGTWATIRYARKIGKEVNLIPRQ